MSGEGQNSFEDHYFAAARFSNILPNIIYTPTTRTNHQPEAGKSMMPNSENNTRSTLQNNGIKRFNVCSTQTHSTENKSKNMPTTMNQPTAELIRLTSVATP